ncbi:MAG: PKD domain-containing protein, partial [Thermoplasmata archaeon]|nr:PKD domain-containing protein [Thermoplasmata archaeon]
HAFASSANFSVVAYAKDSNGMLAASSFTVDVSPIQIQAHSSPASALVGGKFTFSAVASGGAGGPFNFTWNLGDGTKLYGATVVHAYPSKGTFSPTVVVTDALGANGTSPLSAISVSTAPGPTPWLTTWSALGILLLAAILVGVGVYLWRRQVARTAFSSMQGRVPPAGPDDVVKGAKICASCGVSNLPIRRTCTNCGRPLRRSPFG